MLDTQANVLTVRDIPRKGYTRIRHESIVLGQNMEKSRNLFIGKYPVLSPGHFGLCAKHTGT